MQLLIVLVLYATLIAQSLSIETNILPSTINIPQNNLNEDSPIIKEPSDPENNSTSNPENLNIVPINNYTSVENNYLNEINESFSKNQQTYLNKIPPFFASFNNKSISHSLSRQLFGCRYISEIVNIDEFSTWKASPVGVHAPPLSQVSIKSHDNVDYTSLKAYKLIDDYPGIILSRSSYQKLPKYFDSRTKYYYCPNLQRVEDQGCNCKASWAIAPVSALADRICITSRGKDRPYLSPSKLLSCCSYCTPGHGCEGGHSLWSWVYLRHSGTVTGGPYGSDEGCQNYKVPPCLVKHDDNAFNTPKCIRGCDNKYPSFKLYTTNKSYAHKNTTIAAIQNDIFNNGPVTADMKLYEDFFCYKKGIYTHLIGEQVGVQTVKIIGWGEEHNVKYWIAANSWGVSWGENGFFKIERGTNECNIEYTITAGFPRLQLDV